MKKRDTAITIVTFIAMMLLVPISVSAKSPITYFELGEGEEKQISVGNQDYLFKVNRIFKRQAAIVLPDGKIDNYRIFDEKYYWFKENNKLTLKYLGVSKARTGLVARFYAKNEEIWNQEKPAISYSVDHDATPPILADSIETGEVKKYLNGAFEHELEMLYGDTNHFVYLFDGVRRIATTGGKIRLGASDDIIYLRPIKVQKLNVGHRVYFEIFSPDFEVKLANVQEKA